MSFITKRERVFNGYELLDLPTRNEGKLKAYSSCTDARAWSHFCSDKSEHLVEIIKRNNDTCRPKYVPTETIVNTLMFSKNSKISGLQRKIEEFEQMMAAYDDLDLTCEQKCEIAKAHAAIREANKDLNGLYLNLDMDLSMFTEGSEAFETGKSRGDEGDQLLQEGRVQFKMEYNNFKGDEGMMVDISNQANLPCGCTVDATTSAADPRIQEMQDTIVTKDARLSAMQNTVAVMENDVCEPYCIYAHIYTALEKIFAILCQNDKYKSYLNLMTSGKDTRFIDIKGKILFKLKVLEKFSLALIAPCSQVIDSSSDQEEACSCYRAELSIFALTSEMSKPPELDSKRAQLVADIMENDEMKEILGKENNSDKDDLDLVEDLGIHHYNIEAENLKRLKNLQENFDDLMTCYEDVKCERECLQIRCRHYDELQKELDDLKGQLRECDMLWNEKEHYRKRSVDLDSLKEQYIALSEETSNIEIQLKAETEINNIKSKSIDELRQENIMLQQKVNEASIIFNKEKNALECKLKESECQTMCQDQQIKSLSIQIDRLLEQEPQKEQREEDTVALHDKINSLNEQITNLKAVCICNNEENQQLQEELQTNLINSLKMKIEELKCEDEEIQERNLYLEKKADGYRNEINKLQQELKDKSEALDNLREIVTRKSLEVNKLIGDMEQRNKENCELYNQVQHLQEMYDSSLSDLKAEKCHVQNQLLLATQESKELIVKVKSYDDLSHKHDELVESFQFQSEEHNNLKSLLAETRNTNLNLQHDLSSRDIHNSILLQEVEELRETIRLAEIEKENYKQSVDFEKLRLFKDLSDDFERLKMSHDKLNREKKELEVMLEKKTVELDVSLHSIHINKQESEELSDKLHETENLKLDFTNLNHAYATLLLDKQGLQNNFEELLQSFNDKYLETEDLNRELSSLKLENGLLHRDFDSKTDEYNNLYNSLENKIEENKDLRQRLSYFEDEHKTATNNLTYLKAENDSTKSSLTALRKESAELFEKVQNYEELKLELYKLKKGHAEICKERDNLQSKLDDKMSVIKSFQRENRDLSTQSQELLTHSEVLEKALIDVRTELKEKSSFTESSINDIIKEIEELKKEKIDQHKNNYELLDKLEESEHIVTKLYEIIETRDVTVKNLQNHINLLQDEILKLHDSLKKAVDTGEQITDRSSQKINQSIVSMEAHHSKATHNMKIELVKLQSTNSLLEESISATKMKTEENMRRKKLKYLSELGNLQHEKEMIVTDIKQLEVRSVGDSALSPQKCEVIDILESLNRIGDYLDSRCSKIISLEKTLRSVQNSVQTKTDEAKKIIENEKLKILSEKEEAIKDKNNMEKQLKHLKEQVIAQNKRDDLEAEKLNQMLISEKINQSFVAKLEGELKSLQQLYQNSLQKIEDLENKLKMEENHYVDYTQKISKDFKEKNDEVEQLKLLLAKAKRDPGQSIGTQTIATSSQNTEKTDDGTTKLNTDKTHFNEMYEELSDNKNIDIDPIDKKRNKAPAYNNKKQSNEVEILTANIAPTFNYVKSSYTDYKLKQLGQGNLEVCSISGSSDLDDMDIPLTKKELSTTTDDTFSHNDSNPKIYTKSDSETQKLEVTDYNKESEKKYSSKGKGIEFLQCEDDSYDPNKSGVFTVSNDDSYNKELSTAIDDKLSHNDPEPKIHMKSDPKSQNLKVKGIYKKESEINDSSKGKGVEFLQSEDDSCEPNKSGIFTVSNDDSYNKELSTAIDDKFSRNDLKPKIHIKSDPKTQKLKVKDIYNKELEKTDLSKGKGIEFLQSEDDFYDPNKLGVFTVSNDDSYNKELSTAIDDKFSHNDLKPKIHMKSDPKTQNLKVIDIFNKELEKADSLKAMDIAFIENADDAYDPNIFTVLNRSNNDSSANDNKSKKQYKRNELFGSTSGRSTDRDLFMINRGSDSNSDKSNKKEMSWSTNGKSDIIVEDALNQKDSIRSKNRLAKDLRRRKHENYTITNEEEEYEEDDSVKHKVKISLPRVEDYSPSIEYSDSEKKSLDSYVYSTHKAYSSSDENKASGRYSFDDEKNKKPSNNSRAKTNFNTALNGNVMTDYKKENKSKFTDIKPSKKHMTGSGSHNKLARCEAEDLLLKSEEDRIEIIGSNSPKQRNSFDFGLNYILDSKKYPGDIDMYIADKDVRRSQSDEQLNISSPGGSNASSTRLTENKTKSKNVKSYTDRSVLVKLVTVEEYEKQIQALTKTLENIEKDYKKKIDAIKIQYDNNIKSILNEHNQGVQSIQNLHEEALQDILKIHENEVENLRTMSIEAMRKADKLEQENKSLKNKFVESCSCLDQEPTKIRTLEVKQNRNRSDTKNLTKTYIEEFDVKPNSKAHGPCTCTLDVNISDTIRSIFEQVDVEQRKVAEQNYLRHIANKIIGGSVDALDTQELAFLHLKVCRIWKTKISKEESLQKRIDSLEAELMSKQKHTQQNIAELDRKVAEERRRLQEVREAVCRSTLDEQLEPNPAAEREFPLAYSCCGPRHEISEKRSAGDVMQVAGGLRPRRVRNESNRAVLAKLDAEDRRQRKIYTDEPPTRLRKSHDRERTLRPKK